MAAVLRTVLHALLLRTFRAGRPVAQQRRWLERIARLTLAPRGVKYRGATRGVPGELVSIRNGDIAAADRVVLYLHGGAYCVGSPRTHRAITGTLALASRARVFAADYRLAPEHPFPAALEDSVNAYRALLADGYAPARIALAGDSAGGGLALATAVRLRELGLPSPAALVLFSPWVDLTRGYPAVTPPVEVMLSGPWMAECARRYAGDAAAVNPHVSPLHANLRGLPATLVQVGHDELLLDDSRRIHAALVAAGGTSTLHEFAGCWHVFQLNAGVLPDADRALQQAGAFLRSRFAP